MIFTNRVQNKLNMPECNNKNNSFWMTFKTSIILTLLIFIVVFGSSCTNRGHVAINGPYVLDPDKTKASLEVQRNNILKKAGAFEATQINRRSRIQESKSKEFKMAMEGMPNPVDANGVAQPDTTSPDLPKPGEKAPLPTYKELTGDTSILLNEKLRDLAAKENHLEGIKLKYGGDVVLQGNKAKIYMVEFDLWVDPERQNYLTYPLRFLSFNMKNYTKDYHAEVNFILPSALDNNNDQQIIVHAVQPISEGITANEDWLNEDFSSLGIAYRQAASAAQMDLAERIRQQMVEQRKHPLVRGVIDSPREFHFVLSPRQQIEERKFYIKYFMNKFDIVRRLEQERRKVYAYIILKDIGGNKIEDYCKNLKKNKDAMDPLYKKLIKEESLTDAEKLIVEDAILNWHLDKGKNYEDYKNKVSARIKLQPSCDSKNQILNVPIFVYANYKDFGSPFKTGDMLPIRGGSLESPLGKEDLNSDNEIDGRIINIKLPLERITTAKEIKAKIESPEIDASKAGLVGLKWANMELKDTVCTVGSTVECKGVSLEVLDKTTGIYKNAGNTDFPIVIHRYANKENFIRISGKTKDRTFRFKLTYNGKKLFKSENPEFRKIYTTGFKYKSDLPVKENPTNTITPDSAGSGQIVKIEIDRKSEKEKDKVELVDVLFGQKPAVPLNQSAIKVATKLSFQVYVPENLPSNVVSVIAKVKIDGKPMDLVIAEKFNVVGQIKEK